MLKYDENGNVISDDGVSNPFEVKDPEIVRDLEDLPKPKAILYLEGHQVEITGDQLARYQSLVAELDKVLDSRNLQDLTQNDNYWKVKFELDSFLGSLKG